MKPDDVVPVSMELIAPQAHWRTSDSKPATGHIPEKPAPPFAWASVLEGPAGPACSVSGFLFTLYRGIVACCARCKRLHGGAAIRFAGSTWLLE